MHPGDVSVHAAQLHGPGAGVGEGVGGEVGPGVGVGLGVGAGVAGGGVTPGRPVALGAAVGATAPAGTVVPGVVSVQPGEPGRPFGMVGAAVGAIAVECDLSIDVPGEGLEPPATPDTARTVAVAAVAMPIPPAAPPNPPMLKTRPRMGSWATHAPMPIVRHRRPTDTLRKARTITGSSCVPATRTSSRRAAAMLIDFLYGRGAVITS
jgi:hypothetical protein